MARFKPDTLALTALFALLISVGPISTDMYLPVMPDISAGLSATTAQTQATLSGYLVGYAIAQVFYGPLSDRLGRRPVTMASLALFSLGGFVCAIAPTIEVLIGARVIQALGGAGSIVLARAAVRDLYEGPRAGRELATMGTLMALVPALAPILGAALGLVFGWRSIFIFLAAVGPVLALLVFLKMPETLASPSATPFSLKAMLADFAHVWSVPAFRTNTLFGALCFAGFMAFLSGGSFVLQSRFGWDGKAFALGFALVVFGFLVGASIARRKVMAWGVDRTIRIGVMVAVPSALAMLASVLAGWGGALGIIIPMAVYQVSLGLINPMSNAAAMLPFGTRAGSASSLYAVVQMGVAAISGSIVGLLLDRTMLALPGTMTVCAGLMGLIVLATRRQPAPPPG